METADAGLAGLPLSLVRACNTRSFAILVVGRQANAGASLGFGNVGGRHFGGNLVPPFSGIYMPDC